MRTRAARVLAKRNDLVEVAVQCRIEFVRIESDRTVRCSCGRNAQRDERVDGIRSERRAHGSQQSLLYLRGDARTVERLRITRGVFPFLRVDGFDGRVVIRNEFRNGRLDA